MKDIELAERLECLALGNPAITFTDKADLALAAARLRQIAEAEPTHTYAETFAMLAKAAPAPDPTATECPRCKNDIRRCDCNMGAPAPSAAQTLVNAQAEDEGLWFAAQTAPEAYLQEALRKLHAAVEHDAKEPK